MAKCKKCTGRMRTADIKQKVCECGNMFTGSSAGGAVICKECAERDNRCTNCGDVLEEASNGK